jgi:septal ring factor EnvC (AmiA/AmiB activator)
MMKGRKPAKSPIVPVFGGVIGILIAALLFGVASAQSVQKPRDTYTTEDLAKIEAARDAALKRLRTLESASKAAAREAADIDADLLAAAADTTRREEAALDAEIKLVEYARQTAAIRGRLLGDEAALEDLLAALMSFGSRRPPALAASPDDTGAAIRAAILMGDAAPALAERAGTLRDQIRTLAALAESTRDETRRLANQETALAARREEIAALATEKRLSSTALLAETQNLRAETERLAAEAETLRELLDGLAKAAPSVPGLKRPAPPQARPSAPVTNTPAPASRDLPATAAVAARPPAAPGAPVSPALGTRKIRFGEILNGARAEGLTLSTRSAAQVVAPLDARVQYAGVFRTYGQMLILDVGGDVLVIVAGLDALYPEAGQWVLAGEPIGRMSDRKSPSPELYLEVRSKGQPVDPEKWLARGA